MREWGAKTWRKSLLLRRNLSLWCSIEVHKKMVADGATSPEPNKKNERKSYAMCHMELVPHMVILSDCCCCWWCCGCDIPDWMMRCRVRDMNILYFKWMDGWMDGWPDAILAASVYTFLRVYHKQPTKHLFCSFVRRPYMSLHGV